MSSVVVSGAVLGIMEIIWPFAQDSTNRQSSHRQNSTSHFREK